MVTSGLLQTLIDSDFGYRHEGRTWGRSEKHTSLVVDEKTQRWYWNSEDKSGDALQYLIQIRGMNRKSAQEYIKSLGTVVGLPQVDKEQEENTPYEKLIDVLWEFGKTNREYWYSRKLKDSTIDSNKLGFFGGWSTIPLYENGKFVNFQCRRDEPTRFFKYWYEGDNVQPVLINAEILQLVDTVYITEGVVDCILLNQEGIPSVAHTGGSGYWNPSWYPLFSRVKDIYYIADNDKAGRFASSRVASSLGQSKVKIFQYSGEKEKFDTVDYFRAGGTAQKLVESIHSESKYCFEMAEPEFHYKKGRKSKR